MLRRLVKANACCLILSWLLVAQAGYSKETDWRLSAPCAIGASQNDVKRTKVDFSSGLGVDRWQWRHHNWFMGPGFGIYGTIPAFAGNDSVSVNPYTLFSELRFTGAYGMLGNMFGFMPFLQIKSQIGASIIWKKIAKQRSSSTDVFYGIGPAAGIIYWFGPLGVAMSYAVTWGSEPMRQQMELSILLKLPAKSA